MAHFAILIPSMGGGGAERVALTLCEGFVERGHAVDLVLLQARGELIDLLPRAVRIVDLKASSIRRAIYPLARYMRQNRPEGLLAMMWPMPVIAIISRLLARSTTRVVANDHGIISQHYQNAPSTLAAARFTIRAFYPFADQRVAVSEGVANDLAAISGLSRSRIHVIANPIKPPPERIEVGDEIERLWGKNGARILSVGSLKAEKDYELLLNAFSRLARRIEARLIILGEGEQRGELEAQARRLGIFDRVVMPGFRPDPWPFYASAHLLTLSSTTEGFGNVLVEAMAVGTPVVSTDCAGPREILRDGTLGRLVAGGNVDALAEAMELTLAEAPDREQLKARAWDFRPECALDQYIELMIGR